MRWVVIFEDAPQMLAVRAEREPLHLEFLARHRDEIVLAGGCRPAPGAAFVGGLWVLEVPSRERAVELIEADPYYAPAWRTYRLLVWGKAFPDVPVSL